MSNSWSKDMYVFAPCVNDQARDRGWHDKGSYRIRYGGFGRPKRMTLMVCCVGGDGGDAARAAFRGVGREKRKEGSLEAPTTS